MNVSKNHKQETGVTCSKSGVFREKGKGKREKGKGKREKGRGRAGGGAAVFSWQSQKRK